MGKKRGTLKLQETAREGNKFIWAAAILALLILILASITDPFSVSNIARSDSTTNETELDILYLHGRSDGGTLLQPYSPGDSAKNYTLINSTQERKFGHNILDRKYNSNLKPEVNIYINSFDKTGMILNFKIEFYLFEGNTLLTEPVATAIFSDYTTKGSLLPELIELRSSKYDGEPVDIESTGGFGASVRLTVWRTDNMEQHDVKILCGANEKVSWVRIPYDRSLSSTRKNGEDSTPMDSGLLLIVAICSYCFLTYYRKKKRW
jgi:hypothetical protein